MQAMKASLPRADDDDDDDSGVEGCRSGPDESAPFDAEGDYLGPSDIERGSDVDWEIGDVGLSFAEASDGDDLVNLDAEIPVDVTMKEQTGKRKRQGPEKEDVRISKRKLRTLPTFASYEDYTRMIEDGPDENM